MPDSSISNLTAITSVERAADVLAIDDVSANVTRKVTLPQLMSAATAADLPTHTHTVSQITDIASINNNPMLLDVYEDFISGSTSNWYNMIASNSGGGTNVSAPASPSTDIFGIVRANTGSTATGRSGVVCNAGALWLGQANLDFTCKLRCLNLSTATDEFIVQAGIASSVSTTPVDGIYFKYDRTVSLNWLACVRENSVETQFDTGVAVGNFNVWVKFRITISNTMGLAMWINDVPTTVPAGTPRTSNSYGLQASIFKQVGVTGSTMDIDFIAFKYQLVGVTR